MNLRFCSPATTWRPAHRADTTDPGRIARRLDEREYRELLLYSRYLLGRQWQASTGMGATRAAFTGLVKKYNLSSAIRFGSWKLRCTLRRVRYNGGIRRRGAASRDRRTRDVVNAVFLRWLCAGCGRSAGAVKKRRGEG